MNNGHMNVASILTAMPLTVTAQEASAAVVVTKEGAAQTDSDFAGLLSGLQSLAQMNTPTDPNQVKQSQMEINRETFFLDAVVEESVVAPLERLEGVSLITTGTEHVSQNPDAPEEPDISADALPQVSELSNVTSQMVLAAYAQPGRTPEITIPVPLAVDMPQNAAMATEQQVVITAAAATATAVAAQTAPVAAQTAPTEVQPETPARTAEMNKPAPVVVDRSQNAAMATEQRVAITAATATAVATQTASVAAQTAPAEVQPETTARTAEVNKPAPVVVDRPQNAAMVTEQQVAITAATATTATTAAATAAATQMAPVAAQTAPTEVQPETTARTAEVNKLAPVVVDRPQNAAMATEQPADNTAPSSELELEIQLSQPLPITVRAAAATATLLNETRTTRLHPGSDPLTEKVRTGTDASAVKEMTSALLMDAADSMGLESSHGSDNNQGLPDAADGNPDTAQNMPGQLLAEPQKVSGVVNKSAAVEPLRQDLPEQVVHQVKERLDQHDIKPGKQQITLTLSPENLGELKMYLNLQGQKLSVEIVAENRTVRDIIVQHTEALKESLARQNITMESFDVTTGGKGSGNQGQNQNAWLELAKQQQQQQFWTSPRGYNTTAQADLPSIQALHQRQQGNSMLDIHY